MLAQVMTNTSIKQMGLDPVCKLERNFKHKANLEIIQDFDPHLKKISA
jgi:hypothetical protein